MASSSIEDSSSTKSHEACVRTPPSSKGQDHYAVGQPGWDSRFDGINHDALLRKIDWHILPYICLTYMIVRGNLFAVSFLQH